MRREGLFGKVQLSLLPLHSGDEGGGEISGEEVVWNGWGEGAGGDGADDGGFC